MAARQLAHRTWLQDSLRIQPTDLDLLVRIVIIYKRAEYPIKILELGAFLYGLVPVGGFRLSLYIKRVADAALGLNLAPPDRLDTVPLFRLPRHSSARGKVLRRLLCPGGVHHVYVRLPE